jgi:pyruvate dehydrogenase E2 component (dihydrolipoamide acetyltransferase)
MPFEITMPQLGLTMEQGTVVEWLVEEGDQISAGQEIFLVETDKSVIAVEAHRDGVLARILVPAHRELLVGTVLAVGIAPGEALPLQAGPGGEPVRRETTPEFARQGISAPPAAKREGPIQASWKARALARDAGLDLETMTGNGPGGRIVAEALAAQPDRAKATPVAANLATSLGLDLSGIIGSGSQGRITQGDVLAAAAAIIRRQETEPAAPLSGLPQVAHTAPLKGVRKIVSEGMAASAQTTARVTLFREVDATQLIEDPILLLGAG